MRREAGILYVSTGDSFNAETLRSARSAKDCMPDIPLALFTDKHPSEDDARLFDSIVLIENPSYSFADKIPPLKASPFEKTLFVDTDTVFLDSVTEVFELLDKFDLAYCQAPFRATPGEVNRVQGVPPCFTEPNTGVIAFSSGDQFRRLVDRWEAIYSEQQARHEQPLPDQPAFRKALYESAISAYVLPPEYNLRTPFPMFKGGGLSAKILHGRGGSLERAIAEVGGAEGPCVYDFSAADPGREFWWLAPQATAPSAGAPAERDDPGARLRAWIIANLFEGNASPGFDDDTDLILDGVMDSLAIMRLLTHLESDHGIEVAAGDIAPEHFQSVRAISDYIARRAEAAAADPAGDPEPLPTSHPGARQCPQGEPRRSLEERGRELVATMPHVLAYPGAEYVLAPYVNTALRPNMQTEFVRSDAYGFRVSHDRYGIVDSRSWFDRPRRALLLGNSFAMGWSCSGDDQTIASHLGRLTPYSFLNLGITGASSLQETIAAIPFLADSELVVIVSGVGNPLHYLEYGGEYDLFGAFFPQHFFLGVGQARIDTLTAALRLDKEPADAATGPRGELAAAVARHARTMGTLGEPRMQWSEAQVRERLDLAARHHCRDLRLLLRALEPDSRILYVMQPTSTLAKPELEPDEQALLAAVRQFPIWKEVFEPYVMDRLPAYTAAVRRNCETLGVPYVDLNEVDYRGVCFVDYGHTTDTANAQIAEYIAIRLPS